MTARVKIHHVEEPDEEEMLRVSVYMDSETYTMLTRLAYELRLNKSSLIRLLVREKYKEVFEE